MFYYIIIIVVVVHNFCENCSPVVVVGFVVFPIICHDCQRHLSSFYQLAWNFPEHFLILNE